MRRGALVGLVLSVVATPAVAEDRSPATELVRKLVATPPRRMSELEKVLGPIHMSFASGDYDNMGSLSRPRLGKHGQFSALVPSLFIQYFWDMYHQDPHEKRDVSLETYRLEIRGDATLAAVVLRASFGEPKTFSSRPELAGYAPFYLRARTDTPGTFSLEWYAQTPRFAIPEPDARARSQFLRGLHKLLESSDTIDDVDKYCHAAASNVGVTCTGTLNTHANPYGRSTADARDYWLELVPPVKAVELAKVFSWQPAVGYSGDVHMSHWQLRRKGASWYPVTGASKQWEIDASLTHMPLDTDQSLGADDEVGTIAIAPRFQ